jgi:lysozyme family protein
MADYRKVLDHVKQSEGGFSAHPEDNAAAHPSPVVGLDRRYPALRVHTNKGVTWAAWEYYAKVRKFTPTGDNFTKITETQWKDLLKVNYWDRIKGDDINSQGVAEIIFEAIWGGGSFQMIQAVQTYLRQQGVDIGVDGKIGPKTVAALNKYTKNNPAGEEKMVKYLTNARLIYYQGLKDWWKFGNGWTDRAQKQMARAIAYIGENPTQAGGGIVVAIIAAYIIYAKYA